MSTSTSTLLVPLDECRRTDADRVGRKAAVLGELMAGGFAVPAGVVVLPDAGELPDAELSVLLEQIASLLGPGPFAVRSSGVAEDLDNASFAGQYETELNVPVGRLVPAARFCWASAVTDRVLRYRPGLRAPVAVLVQRMVRADAAGVAFTADPVTGERDKVLVSAVRGLGDRLVNGDVSPDEWIVRDDDAQCRCAPEGAVAADQVRAVARLARRVEAEFGAPQDIEWAIAGGELALLQSRPITALPVPVEVDVSPPPGYWERDASHAPTPWTPMLGSVFFTARNNGMRAMFERFGFLVDTLEFTQIGGWEYNRLVPLGGKDRPAPPPFLMPLLIRVMPALRSRIRTAVAAVRTDLAGDLLRRWYQEWQHDLAARIDALGDVDLAALDEPALLAHADAAQHLLDDGIERHFLLHGALGLKLADLVFTCRELLGWPDARAFELLNGLSAVSTRPAHRLADLARTAAARPAVRELLLADRLPTVDELRACDPEVSTALEAYVRQFGRRALRYEIADPSIAELPDLTVRLLADQVRRGYDPEAEVAALARVRTEAAAGARAVLATATGADRERFDKALAAAERAYPVREDNEFFTVSAPLAVLRYAVLEIGRRLAATGLITRRDDVFWLTLPEARSALAGDLGDAAARVTRAIGERAWIEQHPGPAAYGTPPGPPPGLEALPPEARFTMRALLWTVDTIFAAQDSNRAIGSTAATDAITGIPASAGRYTGPVVVVRDEREFARIRPGDVLVCPVTSPVWSVVFPSIGALVTDSGGLLSHPAIIAREYRIPAVVATANATAVLHDGQLVTVDGSSGRVELVEQTAAAMPVPHLTGRI